MRRMKIGDKSVGDGMEPLMFAEEGQANQGDMHIAVEMIRQAKRAGADGIEFQFFRAGDLYINGDPGYQTYLHRELRLEEMRDLIHIGHDEGLIVQVAGLSPMVIEYCAKSGADVFCVNATDLTNPMIIDPIISTGKPFWIATLMATMEEIDWVVNYTKAKAKADIGLLHGQHIMSSDKSQGVPATLLQLDCIDFFKKRYEIVTGFVDHTATSFVPALSVAKGAETVFKHLSPKKDWTGPDSSVCLDPESWKAARQMLRYAWESNGSSKELSQGEVKDRSLHRRSIYTTKNLPEGHIIDEHDLAALRPGKGGIDPRERKNIIGRKVRVALPAQYQIHYDDLV